jgi:7-carboxy-7-deazaguanine synthase
MAAVGAASKAALKIVVFNEADYLFAREAAANVPELPLFLQVGTPLAGELSGSHTPCVTRSVEWLLERVTRDGWNNVTVLPQMHVMLWGSKRGV